MPYNTNFIVNINNQYFDLGTLLYKWNTNTINIPSSGQTLNSYTINYSSPTMIRESDISVTMDGSPLNADQVYTFGPVVQNKIVLMGQGNSGNGIAFSNDGISFNSIVGGSSQIPSVGSAAVLWDGLKWVACYQSTGNVVLTSYDGVNWSQSSSLPLASGNPSRLYYNGRMYLLVFRGNTGTNIYYSTEGINWLPTTTTVPISNVYSLAWNGVAWLAGGTDTVNTLAYSVDGMKWVGIPRATSLLYSCNDLCWTGDKWVGIGVNASSVGIIAYNTDPYGQTTWTIGDSTTFALGGNTLAWNGLQMIATGNLSSSGTGNTFAYSGDGISWTGLGSIVYNGPVQGGRSTWNGRFFINGAGGTSNLGNTFATSYNGINWIPQGNLIAPYDIGINNRRLHSVTFQRNLTICNGGQLGTGPSGNMIAYSLDGINFYPCNTNFLNYSYYIYQYATQYIQYNGRVWLAYTFNTTTPFSSSFAASRDGINWYGLGNFNISLGQNAYQFGISWLGNKFIIGALINGTIYICHSYDGFTIIPVAKMSSYILSFAYNGSIYLAAANNTTNPLYYSYDSITWNTVPNITSMIGTTAGGFQIVTNGKIFILNGLNIGSTISNLTGNTLAYSYDGLNWNLVTPPTSNRGNSFGLGIATNGTMFVTCGNGSSVTVGTTPAFSYSYDGIKWYNCNAAAAAWNGYQTKPQSIVWNGRMWVITGVNYTGASNSIAYSYDGINWYPSSSNNQTIFNGNTYTVATNYGVKPIPFIQHPTLALGSGQNTIAYSPDGINWTGLGKPVFSVQANTAFWSGSFWIAGGQGGNTMAYSYDGIQWTGIVNTIIPTSVLSVTYNGIIWVAVGTSSNIAYSSDGFNWKAATTTNVSSYASGSAVYWNGSFFVITGTTGTGVNMAYSKDGINWSNYSAATTVTNGISASNGIIWVAGGTGSNKLNYFYNNSTAAVSLTGWNAITPDVFTTSGNCVCYGGIIWLAGGLGGNSLAYSSGSFDSTGVPNNWVGLGTTNFPNGCSSICWNGTRFVGAGGSYIGYSGDGIKWYSTNYSSLFTYVNYVVSNPGIGAFVPPSAIVLNNNGISMNGVTASQTLEIVSSDPYFQTGFTNVSFNITSSSIY